MIFSSRQTSWLRFGELLHKNREKREKLNIIIRRNFIIILTREREVYQDSKMVCVSCFVIPIGIWVWFNFVMPILARIKALIWPEEPKKQEEDKQGETGVEKKHPATEGISWADAKCPFSFCKKPDTAEAVKKTS